MYRKIELNLTFMIEKLQMVIARFLEPGGTVEGLSIARTVIQLGRITFFPPVELKGYA